MKKDSPKPLSSRNPTLAAYRLNEQGDMWARVKSFILSESQSEKDLMRKDQSEVRGLFLFFIGIRLLCLGRVRG